MMKRIAFISLALFAVAALAVSCDGKDDPEEPQSEITPFNWTENGSTKPVEISEIAGPDIGSSKESQSFISNEYVRDKRLVQTDNGFSWAAAGTSLLSGCFSGLGSFAVNKALNALFPADDDMQACIKKLDEVLEKLDDIDKKIDGITQAAGQIYDKLDEMELNQMYTAWNQIDQKIASLSRANAMCFSRLRAASYDQKSDNEMMEIIKEWATSVVGGYSVYLAVENIADEIFHFSQKYNGAYLNYFSAFDLNVYNSLPWEAMGYIYREQYRAEVAAELARGFYLLGFYYAAYEATDNLRSLKTCVQSFEELFKENEVKYHNDVAVCQISGAHFILDVENPFWDRDYFHYNNETLRSTSKIVLGNEGHGNYSWDEIPDGYYSDMEARYDNNFITYQLDSAEVTKIINYYKFYDESKSLLDIFRDGGVKVSPDYNCQYVYDGSYVKACSNDVFFGVKQTAFFCSADDPDIRIERSMLYLPGGDDQVDFRLKNYYDAYFPASKTRVYSVKIGFMRLSCVVAGPSADLGGVVYNDFSDYPDEIQPHVVTLGDTKDAYTKVKEDGRDVYYFKYWNLHHDIKFPGNHFLFIRPGALQRY